jgi:GT2 family glycosyltransferase
MPEKAMDNDDDVVIEDWYLYTDPAKKVLDDVEVCYRVWANGYPLTPNHCVKIIPIKGWAEDQWPEIEVPMHIARQVWDQIPDWKKAAAALRRVAA